MEKWEKNRKIEKELKDGKKMEKQKKWGDGKQI